MTNTTANSRTFDPYGLPDGPGSQQKWEDLARGVEAARAALGWGQHAALYGVMSPAETTARHSGDVSQLRDMLDPEAHADTEQDTGVVMDLVLAGANANPWKLVVGHDVPAHVSALVLVWEPADKERAVAVVTRAGRTAIVRRAEGANTQGSCSCALVNAVRRLLGVPVDEPALTVEQWLGRLAATAAADELLRDPEADPEQVVLAAAAHVATLASLPPSATWDDLGSLPSSDLLPAGVDLGWLGPRALAWFASAHSEQQDQAWQRLSTTCAPAAEAAQGVLANLGWAERAGEAPLHG